MKKCLLVCLSLFAVSAFAQSGGAISGAQPDAHSITLFGTQGLLSSVGGGYIRGSASFPTVTSVGRFDPLIIGCCPQGNGPFLNAIKAQFNPKEYTIDKACDVVSPRDHASGLPTGRRMHLINTSVDFLEFPAMSRGSSPAEILIGLNYEDRIVAKGANIDAKKQKMWLPANFRINIGNLPTQRCVSTSACRISALSPEVEKADEFRTVMNDFSFIIPAADAPSFLAIMNQEQESNYYPMEYVILENNKPVLTVQVMVEILSVDEVNLLPTNDNSGFFRVKVGDPHLKHRYVGTVTIVK